MPAKSRKQQRLMGAALAAKRGRKGASKKIAKVADSMNMDELKKMAHMPMKKKSRMKTTTDYDLRAYN